MMKPKSEIELLKRLLEMIDNGPAKKKRWLSAALTVFLWVVVFSAAMLYFRHGSPHWSHALLAITFLSIGVLATRDVYSAWQRDQWPILSPHLDSESIRARLTELGA